MKPFEIHPATSVAEALELADHYGEAAKFYAGGTELLLALKAGLLHYDHLIDLKTITGMDAVHDDASHDTLTLGALVTHRQVERDPVVRERVPLISEVIGQIANVRVRTVGTLGGNLCFAEPHSDPATLFTVLGARLEVVGPKGARTLGVEEFLVDAYETALAHDEILTRIAVPFPTSRTLSGYQRFQIHERPAVNVAVSLILEPDEDVIQEARVAVGCVHPKPYRAEETEALLQGLPLAQAAEHASQAARAVAGQAHPMDDLDGPADYKRHLVGVLFQRAFRQAIERADKKGKR